MKTVGQLINKFHSTFFSLPSRKKNYSIAMKHPYMNFLKSVVVLTLVMAAITACNDDDDNSGPEPVSFPHTIAYHSIQQQSLQLWVGGDLVSTAGIDPQDLIPADDHEIMTEAWFQDEIFIFTADSISSSNDPNSYPYFFSNDTLFVVTDFLGNIVEIPLGTGNLSELKIAQGYMRYCQNSEFISTCQSLGTNSHFNLDQALEEAFLTSLDDMGATDTLLIYNQVVVFKP
jgi:hypothetical protein